MSDTVTDDSKRSREITMTRVLHAPRELVWKVWTDPEHIAKWWGPTGFTNTIHTMDVRAGGDWLFIMHGPDGVDYRNEVRYDEVVPLERIAYTHGPSPKFQAILTFADLDGQTEMHWRMIFPTVEEKERTIEKFRAADGLRLTIGRLANYLAQLH